jgi:hypothetical protein
VDWHLEFERWYIGAFLTLFGLFIVWKGAAFNSCTRFFYLELRDPRLKDRFAPVVARRRELESGNDWAWRAAGLSATLFGILVLVKALSPVIGYALLCADFAIVMSQIYMNMRNRSERRAASLQPRTSTSAVPVLWYVGALASAALALTLIVYPNLRVPAAIVSAACVAIVVVAARTSKMAALLAGDDPDIELYVDTRLRWSRVSGLLALAYASGYVFIAMSTPELRGGPSWIAGVETASWVLFFGFGIWAVARYFVERMRVKATTV